MKNKTVEKLMRFLITLLGAGIGAALAALILPLFSRWYPIESPYAPIALYAALCLVGAAVCFAFSSAIIGRTMKLIAAIERRWDAMPTQQIVLTSIGMIMGLVVAALITQLILSAGASLITISFSALTYVVLGYVGLRIGFHRYRGGKTPRMRRHLRRAALQIVRDQHARPARHVQHPHTAPDPGVVQNPCDHRLIAPQLCVPAGGRLIEKFDHILLLHLMRTGRAAAAPSSAPPRARAAARAG